MRGERADVHLFRRSFGGGDAEILQDFTDYYVEELGRAPNTVRVYVQQTAAVAGMLGKSITEVTPKDLRYEVKRDKSVALGTKQVRITAFRQLHMWALLEELSWANQGVLGVKAPSSPRRVAKPPISLHDAKKLLAACQTPNEYRVIYFGLYLGTRVHESAKMNAGHFFGGDRLTFIGKGNKERTVPVHPRLREVLPTIFRTQPASPGVLECVFTKMRDRYEIYDLKGKKATTHTLRRTCADFIQNKAGFPREVLKAVLGHELDVTDIYAGISFELMQPAIHAINYQMGEPIQLSLW